MANQRRNRHVGGGEWWAYQDSNLGPLPCECSLATCTFKRSNINTLNLNEYPDSNILWIPAQTLIVTIQCDTNVPSFETVKMALE